MELKPCPFCGEKAETWQVPFNTDEENARHPLWKWNHSGLWVIGCQTEDCHGNLNNYTKIFVTRKQAVESWNRRAEVDG